MEFKLPTLKEILNVETGEVTKEEGYLNCELDMSIEAQEVWEETFPEFSKTIRLFDYVEKMKDVPIKDEPTFRIALKILFCFLRFDKKMTFREFTRLFAWTNPEYAKKVGDIFARIIGIVNDRYDTKKNS